MVLRPRIPGAIFREGMARTGDHPPAGGRKPLHRRMADAARGAGEDQGLAFAVRGLVMAQGYRRVLVQLPSGSARRKTTRSCRRKGRSCQNSMDERLDAEARPVGRTRHLANGISRRIHGNRGFQREAAFERARLLRGPGANPAVARRGRRNRRRPRPRSPPRRAPGPAPGGAATSSESTGPPSGAQQFLALLALEIRVEDKTALIDALQQHHADIGQAFLIDGGERHGVGVIGFGFFRIGEPIGKERKGSLRSVKP